MCSRSNSHKADISDAAQKAAEEAAKRAGNDAAKKLSDEEPRRKKLNLPQCCC